MRLALSVVLASLVCAPVSAQDSPYGEEGPQTIPAIVSRKPLDTRRHPWKPAGTMAPQRGQRLAAPLRVDYDGDGVTDTARLVQNGRHAGVSVTSGRTGRTSMAWLIDNDGGLGPDTFLARRGRNSIEVIFPESTSIILFLKDGTPMATYMNG